MFHSTTKTLHLDAKGRLAEEARQHAANVDVGVGGDKAAGGGLGVEGGEGVAHGVPHWPGPFHPVGRAALAVGEEVGVRRSDEARR